MSPKKVLWAQAQAHRTLPGPREGVCSFNEVLPGGQQGVSSRGPPEEQGESGYPRASAQPDSSLVSPPAARGVR